MAHSIKARVAELELNLPEPAQAVGNYVPRLKVGNILYISGQLPVLAGVPQYLGRVNVMEDRRVLQDRRNNHNHEGYPERARDDRRQNSSNCFGADAVQAAQLCALNIIAQIAAEVDDDMRKIAHIVRLGGFVHAHTDFTEHAKIINGASDLTITTAFD